VAIYSTNETNKAGGKRLHQSILLRCLRLRPIAAAAAGLAAITVVTATSVPAAKAASPVQTDAEVIVNTAAVAAFK
jgi:hypothetical protein